MCVLNDLDRFHLVSDVIDRVPRLGARAAYAKQAIRDKLVGRTTVPGCNVDSHSACYKTSVRSLYAESFSSQAHLNTIVVQPQEIVGRALAG